MNRHIVAGEIRSTAGRFAVVAALLPAAPLATPAQAESPLQALRNYQQHEQWESKLDDTMKNLEQIRSDQPTLSPATVTYIEQAISQYRKIVANGGWAEVSAPGRNLKLGSWDRAVVALRHRLVASGDLSPDLISGNRFDSSVCVRAQNVRDLVAWLLETTTPGWDCQQVDVTIASCEREDVRLDTEVPLYLAYVTAWATSNGVVNFREDIYNRDGLNGSEIEGPQIVLQ
ncbi:hypothetical protein [Breoghania sp.]|uniref:hypothetical protein n=1 Tax=Breoghania sp. TaxID=2065378 RepID=UPI0026151BA8|nr:hypothetical protein [Breoghania sp.]MDJ0932283.1 hypothetical protein [Breoghania sp.]